MLRSCAPCCVRWARGGGGIGGIARQLSTRRRMVTQPAVAGVPGPPPPRAPREGKRRRAQLRARLRERPRELYANLTRELGRGAHPEAGHYAERMVGAVFAGRAQWWNVPTGTVYVGPTVPDGTERRPAPESSDCR